MKRNSESLADQVRARLGTGRCTALAGQPACLAAGGLDAVVELACHQVAGFPDPPHAAICRTLQLCGSVPTPADLLATSGTVL